MNTSEFLEKRKNLQQQKKQLEQKINEEYTEIVYQFVKEHSPVKKDSVYEIVKGGKKRRGFNRFVVYTQDIQVVFGSVTILAGVWWLDSNNVPTKWDTIIVLGLNEDDTVILKLSDNQENKDHPDASN